MRAKLEYWTDRFSKSKFPALPCPSCDEGSLNVVTDTLRQEETRTSRDAHGHEDWDPSWETKLFSCLLKCGAANCSDVAFAVGETELDLDHEARDWSYCEWMKWRFITPAPPLIRFPLNCPEKVRDELERSFGLFLPDPSGAGGRIRTGVERLMDQLGIPKTELTKKGKSVRLSLHARILRFHAASPETAKLLLAVKWLGNEGAHGDLRHDEVYEAFEFIEAALVLLYDKTAERLAKRAREVNEREGPVRKRRKNNK